MSGSWSLRRTGAAIHRRQIALVVVEVVLAIAAPSAVIALLQSDAPATGLGVLYLLSVLAVAVRRGQLPALITALLAMLALNYLFIAPRHQFTIAHRQDVAQLVVLLIAAVVVGRLAAASRARAAEAEQRAALAARREREAKLLAEASSAILAGANVAAQLNGLGARLAAATAATGARVALDAVPSPAPEELAMPLRSRTIRAWLYVNRDTSWQRDDLERVAEPLGRLIDIAVERERLVERAADTEAARRTSTARTAILHAISHDLRTPLTAIATANAALRSPQVTEVERAELIDVIDTEATRLAKLVDDLLDVSRIQAGAVDPRRDWCDLRDVVISARTHLHSEHPVELALPDDLPLIRADAAQLERVFSNLLENAIKFSPANAPVRVTGKLGAGRVTVRVLDQGPGVPAGQRKRVFEPFFRARSGRPSGSGAGLGLAICQGFVEANGGQIALQSGDRGATAFAVSFPVGPQPRRERSGDVLAARRR